MALTTVTGSSASSPTTMLAWTPFHVRFGADMNVRSVAEAVIGIASDSGLYVHCGHHIHPMVGTPFEKSRTPLQKWF